MRPRLACLLAALLVGCAEHHMEVPVASVPHLARYREGVPVSVREGHEEVTLTPSLSPDLLLRLDHSCDVGSLLLQTCDRVVNEPLEKFVFDGSVLRVRVSNGLTGSHRNLVIGPREVTSATVIVHGYDPPGWRPIWGVGFGFVGPSGFVSPEVEWLPARWLAFELGGWGGADFGGGFAAVRFRPMRLGIVRPFMGWFGNAYLAGSTIAGVGQRLGVDIEISRGHFMLSPEVDLLHPLTRDETYLSGAHGRWIPWGGVGLAYFF